MNNAAQHHATVVVEHMSGRAVAACIGFDTDSLTGKDLLAASGIQFRLSAYANEGDAVCQMDGEPASYPPDCLKPSYWSIWTAPCGQSWSFAHKGIDGLVFHDYEVEGFHYVSDNAPAPPSSSAGPCAPPAPAAGSSGGSSAGGGATGSGGAGASGTGGAGSAPAGPSPSPSDASTPSPSDSASSASPTPGAVALGNQSSPGAGAGSANPALSARSQDVAGILAAGTAGAVLFGLIAVRLVLPRLRS